MTKKKVTSKKKAAKKKKKVTKPANENFTFNKVEETNEEPKPEKSKKQQILDEHDGLESNIPLNSEYWNLKN